MLGAAAREANLKIVKLQLLGRAGSLGQCLAMTGLDWGSCRLAGSLHSWAGRDSRTGPEAGFSVSAGPGLSRPTDLAPWREERKEKEPPCTQNMITRQLGPEHELTKIDEKSTH